MRAAIFGNSGSGKSTLARWMASQADARLLDLDEVHSLAQPFQRREAVGPAGREAVEFLDLRQELVLRRHHVGERHAFQPGLGADRVSPQGPPSAVAHEVP